MPFHVRQPGKWKVLAWGTPLALAIWLAWAVPIRAQGPEAPPAGGEQRPETLPVEGHRVPEGRLEEFATLLKERYADSPDVRISANKRLNRLLVIAPENVQKEIAAIIAGEAARPAEGNAAPAGEKIARPAAPVRRTKATYPLRNLSAREFEIRLLRAWGRKASFLSRDGGRTTLVKIPYAPGDDLALTVDHERDLISLEATPDLQDGWKQVMQALDMPQKAGAPRADLVTLDKAEPAKIKRAMELIRAASQALGLGPAPKRHIGEFVSMIFQQEEPPAAAPQPGEKGGENPPAEGQPERPAEGAAGAGAEEDLDQGPIGPVQIEYIEGLDILIIRARSQRDVERVKRIIAQIEAESEKTRPEVEIYQLQHVDGAALNDLITQIYTTVFTARYGTVTIVPLGKPNALLLIGRKEAMNPVLDLVKKLDQPVPPDALIRVIRLKNTSAIDAERTLRVFFTGRPGIDQAIRTQLGARVLVVADYRTNSLVVQASPRDMEEISDLLDKLDIPSGPVTNEVRVFRLKNSMADEIITALQEAIYAQQLNVQIQTQGGGVQQLQQQQGQGQQGGGSGGTPTPNRSTPRPTKLQLTVVNKETGKTEIVESGILSDMRISADPRVNALIVTGPPESMDLMGALIEQLDSLPAVSAQIKVFTIKNGDATQLATMLQNLFSTQQQQNQANQTGFLSATGAGETTLVPLRFSVDTRTNSIIASGNPGDLSVVFAVLSRLDEGNLRARVTTVYKLKNSNSDSVTTAVNNYLTSRQQLNQQAPNLVSAVQLVEQAVIVVSEPVSNSLIISAMPQYAEEIKGIVEQLDRRQNMVAVQVLIAEVKLSDIEQMGVELGLQDALLFSRGIGTVGFPFNNVALGNTPASQTDPGRNNVGTQGLSHFGMGRTDASGVGYGGLVISASSDAVNVLVRALQQNSRLQILSRPQVQTLENQTASIQVGSRVRFVSGTTITSGVAQNSLDVEDIGIILQLTPRTNPDGNIIMLVDAIKSELGAEADGTPFVGADGTVINIPPVNTTRASTTVNTRSGQTVILGGLITRNQTETTRRVPYLGDIPVLGRLFRFDTTQVDRTELMIIMTPYIVQTDEQQNWLNLRESERMSWCLADVANIHGEVPYITGQAGMNGSSPLIFPDEMPSSPEALPAPGTEPGIAPPPMGPLPNPLPSTSRRRGPELQPISLTSGQPAPRVVPSSSPPPGALVNGGLAAPSMPSQGATPTLPPQNMLRPAASSGTEPSAGSSLQPRPGQLPPPPALAPREVEPAGFSQPVRLPMEEPSVYGP